MRYFRQLLTIVAYSSILVSVSSTYNRLGIVNRDVNSKLLETSTDFFGSNVSIAISINFIEYLLKEHEQSEV